MVFEREDVVYEIPERYWEDKKPVKCIVKERREINDYDVSCGGNNVVLVYSEEYGHKVYVSRGRLFFTEESCIAAIELFTKLKELVNEDETKKNTERVLKSQLSK